MTSLFAFNLVGHECHFSVIHFIVFKMSGGVPVCMLVCLDPKESLDLITAIPFFWRGTDHDYLSLSFFPAGRVNCGRKVEQKLEGLHLAMIAEKLLSSHFCFNNSAP